MYYTGIDVHCNNCDVTVIDKTGKIMMRKNFETSAKELINAVRNGYVPQTVVLEETTLADWAYRAIKPYVKEIVVSDPRQNNWIAKSRQKNDKIDSFKLAKLLLGGYIKPIYHATDENQHEFKGLVSHYHDQVKELVRTKNKIKAKFRQAGIMVKGKSVYDDEGRYKWLARLAANSEKSFEIEHFYAEMDLFEQNKKETRRRIGQAGRTYPEIKRFMKIPGVGLIVSATFVAIIDTPYRFATKSKLWSYCGLGLVNRESDNRKEPKRLNKACNKLLKYVLKLSAKQAIRKKEGNKFSAQYKRLVCAGVSESNARLSVARGICATMYGMWKSGKEYQPELNAVVID